jgi:hypothetical protein
MLTKKFSHEVGIRAAGCSPTCLLNATKPLVVPTGPTGLNRIETKELKEHGVLRNDAKTLVRNFQNQQQIPSVLASSDLLMEYVECDKLLYAVKKAIVDNKSGTGIKQLKNLLHDETKLVLDQPEDVPLFGVFA